MKFRVGDEIKWTHPQGIRWPNDIILNKTVDQYLTTSTRKDLDGGEYWWSLEYVHQNAKLIPKKEDNFDKLYKTLKCF